MQPQENVLELMNTEMPGSPSILKRTSTIKMLKQEKHWMKNIKSHFKMQKQNSLKKIQ